MMNLSIDCYKLSVLEDSDGKDIFKSFRYVKKCPCLSVGAKLMYLREIKPFTFVFILCCYRILVHSLSLLYFICLLNGGLC